MVQKDEKPPIFAVPGLNTNVGFINTALNVDMSEKNASYMLHIDVDKKLLNNVFFIKSKSINDVLSSKTEFYVNPEMWPNLEFSSGVVSNNRERDINVYGADKMVKRIGVSWLALSLIHI